MLPGKKYTPADIVLMVRRRLVVIIVPLIFGLYAGLVASSVRHEQYQSEMLIQVVPQRVPDTFVQSTVTMRTEDRLNALQQETLSRTTLEGLIREMHLYADELTRMPMEDVVDLMRRNCKVEPVLKIMGNVRDADSFYVRFKYADAEIAKQVTERIGGLFIDLNRQDRGTISKGVNDFAQALLVEKRKTLEDTEAKLERFRQQNVGRLPTQVDYNTQAISTTQAAIFSLDATLSRDRDQKAQLDSRVRDEETELAAANRTVVGTPDRPTAQSQLTAAIAERDKLLLRYKSDYPGVTKKQREIEQLTKLVAAEATRPLASSAAGPAVETTEQTALRTRLHDDKERAASLGTQIQFNEQNERDLQAKLAEHQRHLAEVPGVTSEWTALTRDYDTQNQDYQDQLKKASQSNTGVELEQLQIGEQFKVLDPARVPLRPTGLPRIALNGIGAAAGFFVGLVLAAFLELRDTTFGTGDDVVNVLRLPVVALIPYVVSDVDRRRARRQQLLTSAAAVVLSIAGGYGVWALELWKHVV